MALTLGGEPLHLQLSRDLDAIVRSVVASVADLAPTYAGLPREQVLHEFAAIVATTTRAFIEVVRTGEMPSPEDLEPMAVAAGLRAEEGFPLSDILTAYHVGISLVFDDVVPRATAGDQATLNQVYKLLLGFLARVMEAASRGWLAASSETLREAHGARQALLDAVLGADDARATADRVGLRLSPEYGVMALRIGSHPDEVTPGVEPAVAARRKLRRLRHALEIAQPEALASMTATAATVLVPVGASVQHPGPERIVQEMARAAGAPILAAYEAAPVAAVADALALATEVLDVAAGLGWTTGVVRLQDVAVAYQLTRPSAATSRLAGLLAPLSDQPDLLLTLDTLAAERLNRRRTAKALSVHVNTVNYRLNRIRDLTGLDPADAVDTQTLLAALAAGRAARE